MTAYRAAPVGKPVIISQKSESTAIVPHPPCGGPSASKKAVMQPCYRIGNSTVSFLKSRVFGNFAAVWENTVLQEYSGHNRSC